MIAEAKEINRLVNVMWRFIKEHDIPPQADTEAWQTIMDDVEKLKTEYSGDDPIKKLFRKWVVAYLDYMNERSRNL